MQLSKYSAFPDLFLWGNDFAPKIANENISPSIDVVENDKEWKIYFDLPGVKEEDTHIELSGNNLTVSATRDSEVKEEKNGYTYTERAHGSFRRSFTLPSSFDPENISAESKDGVLVLTVAKIPEVQPKRISIKTH